MAMKKPQVRSTLSDPNLCGLAAEQPAQPDLVELHPAAKPDRIM